MSDELYLALYMGDSRLAVPLAVPLVYTTCAEAMKWKDIAGVKIYRCLPVDVAATQLQDKRIWLPPSEMLSEGVSRYCYPDGSKIYSVSWTNRRRWRATWKDGTLLTDEGEPSVFDSPEEAAEALYDGEEGSFVRSSQQE